MKRIVLFATLVCLICSSCHKEQLLGGIEVELTPKTIVITAAASSIEIKTVNKFHYVPPLEVVREAEFSEDWEQKSFHDIPKRWTIAEYADENYNYPIVTRNPDNLEEMIVFDGDKSRKTAILQIPENKTNKKRCLYLLFNGFTEMGYVTILQNEK